MGSLFTSGLFGLLVLLTPTLTPGHLAAPDAFAETASDAAQRYGNDNIGLAIRDAENKREQERLEKEAAEAAAAAKKGKR